MKNNTYGNLLNTCINSFSKVGEGAGCTSYSITPCGPDVNVSIVLNRKYRVDIYYHGNSMSQASFKKVGVFHKKKQLDIISHDNFEEPISGQLDNLANQVVALVK